MLCFISLHGQHFSSKENIQIKQILDLHLEKITYTQSLHVKKETRVISHFIKYGIKMIELIKLEHNLKIAE